MVKYFIKVGAYGAKNWPWSTLITFAAVRWHVCTCVGLLARVNGMGFCLCARTVVLKSKNPPKIGWPISRVFTTRFQQIHIKFVYCICFTFENCQTVAGIIISRINLFPNFNHLIFGVFFAIWPNSVPLFSTFNRFFPIVLRQDWAHTVAENT